MRGGDTSRGRNGLDLPREISTAQLGNFGNNATSRNVAKGPNNNDSRNQLNPLRFLP